MKRWILTSFAAFLGLLMATSCTGVPVDVLKETLVPPACNATVTAVAATQTATATAMPKVALISEAHGRYVIAQGHQQGFSLSQSDETDEAGCWLFTLYRLSGDESQPLPRTVSLQTCYGGFVTAPSNGSERLEDWLVWQDPMQAKCSWFTLEKRGNDVYALKTCAERYLTAGDVGAGWELRLEKAIVGERLLAKEWELFRIKIQP